MPINPRQRRVPRLLPPHRTAPPSQPCVTEPWIRRGPALPAAPRRALFMARGGPATAALYRADGRTARGTAGCGVAGRGAGQRGWQAARGIKRREPRFFFHLISIFPFSVLSPFLKRFWTKFSSDRLGLAFFFFFPFNFCKGFFFLFFSECCVWQKKRKVTIEPSNSGALQGGGGRREGKSCLCC